ADVVVVVVIVAMIMMTTMTMMMAHDDHRRRRRGCRAEAVRTEGLEPSRGLPIRILSLLSRLITP
ncbi:MAG: hypothetical protein WA884_19710, partial [Methyloceanibacter sp.]